MSAVMVAPIDTVMPCGAMVTDDARAMHRQHPAAASSSDKSGGRIDGGIIVIIGIVIRIVTEVTPMAETASGKSGISSNGRRSGADRAAAHNSAAHAASAEATSTPATAPTTASAVAATTSAMSAAADFDRPSIGNRLADCSHSRIDRRQRFSALAGNGRYHQ